MIGKYIKNIEAGKALLLSSLVDYHENQVVSRTLAQNASLSLTVFSFDAKEQISSHSSDGDAMVTVLEGEATVGIGEELHLLHPGETIVMPAQIPHSVSAETKMKMFLTVVFPASYDADKSGKEAMK